MKASFQTAVGAAALVLVLVCGLGVSAQTASPRPSVPSIRPVAKPAPAPLGVPSPPSAVAPLGQPLAPVPPPKPVPAELKTPAGPPQPIVTILISIEGFRADYLDRGLTPNLAALAAEGARGAMRPSFPTETYPNHYTLVTGLRPDHHGVVGNTMEDARKPGVTFTNSDRATVRDAFWWNEAEPLWVTAERGGVRTASLFWPGDEAAIRGIQPRDWKAYDQKLPADQRVSTVLGWLRRPADQRPRFVALYFDELDTVGHNSGPDSPELNEALTRADTAIGKLIAGLQAPWWWAYANLVIVSDHGMAPIAPARVIYPDSLMPAGSFHAVSSGSTFAVAPEPGHEAEVDKALLTKRPHMTCWRKGEIPARLGYGRNGRVPPIISLAETGWQIRTHAEVKAHPIKKGAHGFDPADPLMATLFVAHGPGFRPGSVLASFDNVAVYPVLAKLIGVPPLANDGKLADLGPALNP